MNEFRMADPPPVCGQLRSMPEHSVCLRVIRIAGNLATSCRTVAVRRETILPCEARGPKFPFIQFKTHFRLRRTTGTT